MTTSRWNIFWLLVITASFTLAACATTQSTMTPRLSQTENTSHEVQYHTVQVDSLDIFYREAGPKDAPTILLLHGFPTSSHMFRNPTGAP